jgi:hypothetical protein
MQQGRLTNRVTRLAVRLGRARALVLAMAAAFICLLCSNGGAVALASSRAVAKPASQAHSTAFQLTASPFARPGAATERPDSLGCRVYAHIAAIAYCTGSPTHLAYALCYATQYAFSYIECQSGGG